MNLPPISTAFIDETKRNGFVLAVCIIPIREIAQIRKSLESMLLPGQSRLHFRKERSNRKQDILSQVIEFPVRNLVLDASSIRNQKIARISAIQELSRRCQGLRIHELVFELDESHIAFDRQALSEAGLPNVHYSHKYARHEPALWIPDAVAWAYAHGSKWRSCISFENVRVSS